MFKRYMANTMCDGQWGGKGFYTASLLYSLFGQVISLVISNDVCVGFDFANDDIVVGDFQCIYYSDYEEFI